MIAFSCYLCSRERLCRVDIVDLSQQQNNFRRINCNSLRDRHHHIYLYDIRELEILIARLAGNTYRIYSYRKSVCICNVQTSVISLYCETLCLECLAIEFNIVNLEIMWLGTMVSRLQGHICRRAYISDVRIEQQELVTVCKSLLIARCKYHSNSKEHGHKSTIEYRFHINYFRLYDSE